ncbi:MAG: FAD synthetase family protein [Treponema sp.]|jgi:riboflavin kinase/FMN adenylyltransferase|nr:FAD synthetase family protein [Treponema sp.]
MSMRVLDWQEWSERAPDMPTAMTIGVFDGVHQGHQALIARIVRQGCIPTVVTFRQNPKRILAPETYGGDILSLSQKLALFETLGVAQTMLIDFSGNFSRLKGREFIDALISRGKLRYLVIGSNFRCGYRLDMDAALISALNATRGIRTEVVPPVREAGVPVSSSRIRRAIQAGDLVQARAALGRNVVIDLEGIPAVPGAEGVFFDVASAYRVIPPPGRYRVVLHERGNGVGKTAEIGIEDGKIRIPPGDTAAFHAGCIEFNTP